MLGAASTSMIEDNDNATNNRFDVAAESQCRDPRRRRAHPHGPFWGRPARRPVAGDDPPVTKATRDPCPRTPVHRARTCVERGRRIHVAVPAHGRSGRPGVQALIAFPVIDRILLDRAGSRATLWPFETITRGDAIVLAEIYPSLFGCDHIDHEIKDARQVIATRRRAPERDGSPAASSSKPPSTLGKTRVGSLGVRPCGEPWTVPPAASPDA